MQALPGSLRKLLFTLALIVAPASRATGVWAPVAGPAGFSNSFSGLMSTGRKGNNQLFATSGLTGVWSVPLPLGASPTWTQYPTAGLGLPLVIDSVVSNAAGQPVLSMFATKAPAVNQMMYLDTATSTWKQATPTNINFYLAPRIQLMGNGELLASSAEEIWTSADGVAWSLRTSMVANQIAAPPPMPASGTAVGRGAFGTNQVTPTVAGFSETFNSMPWGEVFLGTEVASEWHSYDYGHTWEHLDPLYFQPIRDQSGVPLWGNPHLTSFGAAGNTTGAGVTKDAELLVECDRNNSQNFYRFTTTGQVIPIDQTNINLSWSSPSGLQPERIGQTRHFHTLRSGETFTAPTSWQTNQGGHIPDNRNVNEVLRWDGAALSLASPSVGTWTAATSDGVFGADDGTNYIIPTTASSNNLLQWTPDMSGNTRPDVQLVSSPVAVTLSASTGLASLSAASAFTVSDDGLPSNTLTYAWSARGQGPVTFDAPLSLATNALFRMPGWYVLTLTVSDGALSSGNSVMVQVLPAAAGAAPQITLQPANTLLVAGSPAQLSVNATGPQLSYQWLRNGIELADANGFAGTTTATLSIPSASASDIDSTYYARVWNPFGRLVSNAGVLGGPPLITVQPLAQAVAAGTQGTLSVAAGGSQPMTWQWYSVSGGVRTPVSSGGNFSSLVTATTGTYQVDLTNCFGTVSSTTATLATGTPSTFALSTTFAGSSSQGVTGLFDGAGAGSGPIAIMADRRVSPPSSGLFQTWTSSHSGVVFANASAPQTSVTVTNAAAGSTVTITPVYVGTAPVWLSVINGTGSGVGSITTFRAGGAVAVAAYPAPPGLTFDHWVGGPIDGSTSPIATFVMPAADTRVIATYQPAGGPVAPQITTGPTNQAVTAGQTATFSVTATGTAPLTYQWSKGGAPIGGATSSSYTTPATVLADDGALFAVVVTNVAGNLASSAAKLTVTPAPVAPSITTQPANQAVTAGQAATFSVLATGTAPLTYQWSKGGAPIGGATSSSYTTPATVLADDGALFRVAVTNSVSTATSAAATLSVGGVSAPVGGGCGCNTSADLSSVFALLGLLGWRSRRRARGMRLRR